MKKAIPTTEAAKAQDAQQNAQWRVDNCVWCPQKLGQQRKSNERIALNKKCICKKRSYFVSPLKCILSIRWQERVFFSVQKETRDLLHTPRKKRERRERTLKNWGRNSLKRKKRC